jgi:Tol biopolymer transport system component
MERWRYAARNFGGGGNPMTRIALVILALTLAVGTLAAQDLERLFKAAVNTEQVDGNLTAAIEQYKKVAAASNRALAAQALLRMAEAYQKLGRAEAMTTYQRIIRDFPDQVEASRIASARLGPVQNASAATTLRDVDGLNASGNVTADGRYATYVNYDTGNIAVRDLRAGTSREVTRRLDYDVYDPVLSRDGKFVAYQSFNACIERKRDAQSNGVLCVLSTEGEPAAAAKTVVERDDIRRVVPMDWSPDGGSIAVMLHRLDGTAQIGIVRLADAALTVLQSTDWRGSTRVFFSPDGRYVAFDVPVDDSSDQLDIRVVAVDGSHGVTAVQGSSQNIVMGWTPDGNHLLFASDRAGSMGLWAQRITNMKPDGASRLVHAGLGGAFSMGVTKSGALYFGVQSGGRDVEILPVDLATVKQVSSPVRPISRYVGTNGMPEWSRDGKLLAYVSLRGFSANGGRIVGIRDWATGAVRELRPKLTYLNGLAWAPDNSSLITTGVDLRGRSGIFTIDAQSGEIAYIVEGTYAKYAPEGGRIFYVKGPGGPGTKPIVERNLTSGAERTVATGELAMFTVSPDGQWLAAAWGGIVGSAAHEIVVIRVETGEVRPVLRIQPGERIPPYVGLPWTPDGRGVLMRKRAPKEELWLVPTTGASPRKIEADVKGWAFGPAGVISLHPDGRQLAGTRVREDGGASVRVLENFLPTLNVAR